MAEVSIPALAAGERVAGRYRIEALVARGGMGAVYRAVDESTGKSVALKRRAEGGAHVARMFEREYHTLVNLRHPRIIDVYDYGVDALGAYYTMELLDGADLRDLAPLPPARACRYLRDVASSLALLHARRLIHRDVSPRNVRITGEDRGKLIDFGVLASFGVADFVAGTPPFVPPEALGGAPLDQRADLFALGALAYFLLTGKNAYPARALGDLPRLWQSPPVPPSAAREPAGDGAPAEPISEGLDALVLALLGANPLARPASAAEVIQRLTALGGLDPDVESLAAESYLSSGATVGRAREQSRLAERLETALAGTGTSILIEADPGLGSSRLLAELSVSAQLHGALPILVDAKLPRGAYGAIHHLVARLLEAAPEEALSAAARNAPVLAHFSKALRSRLPDGVALNQRLAPGELRMRVQTALADWLFAIAEERPLVLAIDNAHRLDEASSAVVSTLAYHVKDRSIMLAAAIKPAEMSDVPLVVKSLRETGARMQLAPLSEPEVAELVAGMFGDVPHVARLAGHLYRASGGNPEACVEQVRDLVRGGAVRHTGGVWVLPRELPLDPGRAELSPHGARAARLSPACRTLAEALSVYRGALSLERCLSTAAHEGCADAWGVLEELTREQVLGRTGTDYHFVHERLREHLLAGISPERRRLLHRLAGDAFARDAAASLDAMLEAGFHLVQGGEEGRGADLLARAGLLLGYDSDEMGAAIPPLRAALEVFRKERRPPHEIVKLIGPLCNAGWYCDRRLASEFGDETIALLSDVLGLTVARRLRPFLGKHLSLYVGLAFAAVGFLLGKDRGGVEGLRAMLVMYFNCVLSLGGVAATCLDADRGAVLAGHLEHLSALGRDHAGGFSHRFAVLLSEVPRENLARTIAGYRELLERITTRKIRDLPPDSRLMMIGGINYAIGALESFRDGSAALEAATALDEVGLHLYAMVGDQVRANYHACRGEVELADFYRDRVEMHAVRAGSGWQAEVWAPASAILACLVTSDLVGMKRTSEELDRLEGEIPSLGRHAGMARAGVFLLRGDARAARDGFSRILEDAPPRAFIGWGAISGALARCHRELGDFEAARAVAERTLAALSPADRELTAMYLSLEHELSLAEAHLGDLAAASARIDALLSRHGGSGSPVTLATLHRARATIALLARDESAAERHLEAMEHAVEPTKNPGLLQQCEALRAQVLATTRRDRGFEVHAPGNETATAFDAVHPLDGEDPIERTERLLAYVVSQTGSKGGYLFDARGELTVLAPHLGPPPPEHLLDQARRDLRAFARNRRRACTELEAGALTGLGTATLATRTALRPREHEYRTVILARGDDEVVGLVALLPGPCPRPLREGVAQAVARHLPDRDAGAGATRVDAPSFASSSG